MEQYAQSIVDPKLNLRGTQSSVSGIDIKNVRQLFNNPISNYDRIGSYMNDLSKKNGVIANVIRYYTSMPTYYYNLFSTFNPKDFSSNVDIKEYLEIAKELDKYNIPLFAPYFVERTLINGYSCFYEIADNKGVSYLEFPINMAKIYKLENGVYRWMIDVSKLKQELVDIPNFPTEIKKAFEETDRTDPKKWYDGKWRYLSDKAIAFTFDQSVLRNGGVTISPFSPLLPDTLLAEKAKDNVDIKDDIDTVRILHGGMKLDKDGKATITSKEAAKWQSLLKQGLPNGVAAVVTPFELENISLNGSGNGKAYDTVKEAQKQLFFSVGTTGSLFGDTTTSSNITKLSIQKDISWVFAKVMPVLSAYYNNVVQSMKTESGSIWNIRFLRQSIFTYDDDVKRYKDAITLGGSRTDYLSSLGMTPLEIYSKLYMEQNILQIDNLMLPKQASFTMSGATSGEVGRPKTDNPTDDTDRIADSQ
ncbi:hypothetical protein JXA27_07020 [Aerococcaceae bacterium zg-B36]|uniref:hypothetical protein n=1 Tax=Aerococcaceae bacterium zg-252 TaxID=2796928 RepID=UPI001BD892DB|nr:hypothetical protein [Aerococcaceae bacterium zg-B36]